MYLKRIELFGFKSFANKTSLVFDIPGLNGIGKRTGITAIVGPNGSGKSNIADAIRWVMGEQSMKSLRGKKSCDVIFSGSKGKSRLNFAEVVLYFDNSEKKIPLSYEEVSVSRKMYRDGEGEYRINGAKVRLLDVVDLLAAGGIGKESHCVLNQGMSDAILNANPFERRFFVEEAAGVKPFQLKRERALRKLSTSQENMRRTREVIAEIEPRMKMLSRQVKKAQQREAISEELRHFQTEYFSSLWKGLEEERVQAEEAKAIFGREAMRLQREADTLFEKRKSMMERFSETSGDDVVNRELRTFREKLSLAEREKALAEGKLEIECERKKQQRSIVSIPVDLRYVRGEISVVREKQKALETFLDSAKNLDDIENSKKLAREIGEILSRLFENCGKARIEIRRDQTIIDVEEKKFLTRKTELESLIAKRRKEIEETKKEIRLREEVLIAKSHDAQKANAVFLDLEEKTRRVQKDMEEAKDRWNESKIVCARIEVREEELARDAQSLLGTLPKDLSAPSQPIDTHLTEQKISKLQGMLENIGGIDPLITEEYEETRQRYEFLSKELEDLEKAIVSLNTIVKEMDSRIEKEFSRAFEAISREFSHFFSILFDGGDARLERVVSSGEETSEGSEEENDRGAEEEVISAGARREVGIDIKVFPPKKRIYSLSLMSGGERSLVSLALLFAVIAYNPPPFSVLDEVEASLDESNSERFSRILKTLAKKTQFIVITHNRETMRQADVLYGVTLNAEGMSQILSVQMEKESIPKE